jgi:thiamine-monophosphate kinase
MRESRLLDHIYTRSRGLESRFPQVLVGPGHDCGAVALPPPGHALLKVDQVVSGRHFRPDTPVDLVARKAVARVVSDIAAAGGTPVAALAAAALSPGYDAADVLFDALARWAAEFGCPLVGGDIALGPECGAAPGVVLGITGIGAPHPRRGPVLRSGTRPGDGVYVTGALGGSFEPSTGLGRHLTFEPRLREARWLCDTLGADLHSMMDLSDGIGRDAARIAAASGVRLRIDAAAIPRHAGVAGWRAAASEGEDYELLFTVAEGVPVPPSCPVTGTPVARIGSAVDGVGCAIVDHGREIDASGLGYEHGAGG